VTGALAIFMKNNLLSELNQRLYTAIGLLILTYGSIFHANNLVFTVLQTLLFNLIGYEWIRLCGQATLSTQLLYMSYLLAGYLVSYFLISLSTLFIIAMLMSVSLIIYMVYLMQQPVLCKHTIIFKRSVGIISLIIAWRSLLFLKPEPYYLTLGLITIGLTDSSAYLIGKQWGSHPCAPIISPRKTWEGCIAGFLIPVFISIFILRVYFQEGQLYQYYWIVTFLMTSLTALAGDLFESQIKRERGFKDSGNILPGHGGFADRFDSIITSIPVFASGFYWIQHLKHI